MRIDNRLPDSRPYFRAEAARKNKELLDRNQAFAWTVVGAIIFMWVMVTSFHYALARQTDVAPTYGAKVRADITTLFDDIGRRYR